jgi:hypothetical protein
VSFYLIPVLIARRSNRDSRDQAALAHVVDGLGHHYGGATRWRVVMCNANRFGCEIRIVMALILVIGLKVST